MSRAKLSDIDRIGKTLYAYGDRVLLLSTDGGKTWRKLKLPRLTRRASLESVDLISARGGFALTSEGRLWQTRNRGRRWKELPVTGVDQLIEVSFSSAKRGYVAANGFGNDGFAYAFRTTDGGRTWRPQLVGERLSTSGTHCWRRATTPRCSSPAATRCSPPRPEETPARLRGSSLQTKTRKLRRPTTIKVTGKLQPARGRRAGRRVDAGSARLPLELVKRDRRVERHLHNELEGQPNAACFVAQWRGDDDRAGDGSGLLTVKVGR